MAIRVAKAFMSTITWALQQREYESGGGKEDGATLCDGLQLHEEAYTSGLIANFQQPISERTTRDVATARDQQESSPCKPNELQSLTSQNGQRRPAPQESVTESTYPSQDILVDSVGLIFSQPFNPSGSLQVERQETDCQQRPTLSGHNRVEPPEELPHTPEKAGSRHQEGLGADRSQARHLIIPKQGQTRSPSLSGSTLHALTSGSLRSFRRRKPQPWPNPKQSLGEMIETKKIKRKVWVAEGPALELFETQIRPQIEQLLHNTEPSHCAPLLLTFYMIGKTEMRACPIIMICCWDRKVRKDAEIAIRESDILQRFPQIGLGNSDTPLDANGSIAPVTAEPSETHMVAQIPSSFEIHSSEDPMIGRRLRIIDKTEGKGMVRFATGGPFVRIEQHMYQLTAFHVGQGNADTGPFPRLGFDREDCEYDGQSDTEDDESDFEEGTTRSTPLKEPAKNALETESTMLSMDSQKTGSIFDARDRQYPWTPRILHKINDIDYFLVRLSADEASKASNAIGKSDSHPSLQITDIGGLPVPRTQVVVVTSYNRLTGTVLPGKTRVKMKGLHGFQDLLTARLSGLVKPGDSGSAVLDAITGCLYGHVILGTAPDTIAYIVPSVNVFTNVLALFGKLPTLNFVSRI